ncbi:MAG: Omp28-related outer membrane protein [candidate division WOR-3 bacterium]
MTALISTWGRRLIPCCLPLLLLTCSEAPETPLIPTNRVVLAELFTWQRCVYCPYAAHTLDSLVREFNDSVAVIAWHRRVAGDTLSPDYTELRRALYYESGGEPAVVFDGGEVVRTPGPEYNYETYKNYILAARSRLPQAQLEIDAFSRGDTGRVTIYTWGVDSTPAETLRLFVAVTEDSVRPTLSGATDSLFHDVLRLLLPGVEGEPLRLFRAETVRLDFSFTLPGHINPDRLKTVVFIHQPATRKVLQTAKCKVIRR